MAGRFTAVLQMVATCDVYNDVSVYITYYTNVYLVIVLKIWGNNRALVIVTLHTQTKLQNSREPLSYRSFGETLRSFNSFSLTLFAKFN